MRSSWIRDANPASRMPRFAPIENSASAAVRTNRRPDTRGALTIGSAFSPVIRGVVAALPLSGLAWFAILLLCVS